MMQVRLQGWMVLVAIVILSACASELPNAVSIIPVTAVPTRTVDDLCMMGQDEDETWAVRLSALETVKQRRANCRLDIDLLLYLTLTDYGIDLTEADDFVSAEAAFSDALTHYPNGLQATMRLDEIVGVEQSASMVPTCADVETLPRLDPHQASDQVPLDFGRHGFTRDGARYVIYGVRYYPANTPFHLFLTETDLDSIDRDFALLRDTGVNTVRLPIPLMTLFLCDAAVPNTAAFARLDGVLDLAATHDLYLIPILTVGVDAASLTDSTFIQQQIRLIVERYRDEAAIAAWDLRNAADEDYGSGAITETDALRWLADATLALRAIDTRPITISYRENAAITAPFVDFISFEATGTIVDLRQQIASLRAETERPLLLSAIGYSTYTNTELRQRDFLFRAFDVVRGNDLMGWIVNHAFDYPTHVTCNLPRCPTIDGTLSRYGLWTSTYQPKDVVAVIRSATGIDD